MGTSTNADTINFNYSGKMWQFAEKNGKLTEKGVIPTRPEQPHWMVVDEEKGNGLYSCRPMESRRHS